MLGKIFKLMLVVLSMNSVPQVATELVSDGIKEYSTIKIKVVNTTEYDISILVLMDMFILRFVLLARILREC